jgi:drug/metabolite transporter (DMT)-like permease
MKIPKPDSPTLAYVALGLSLAFGISGQLLIKGAALETGQSGFHGEAALKSFLALLVYGLGVLNWIFALRAVRLSVAYPLSSLNYVGIFLGSYYFFDEEISAHRLLGVALIFVGVLLVVLRADAGSRAPA